MRKIEIIRGILGILLFVGIFGFITYRELSKPKEVAFVMICYSCYAQNVDIEDEEVSLADESKVVNEKRIVFKDVEYATTRTGKDLHKSAHLPYSVAEYKTESGETFAINVDTGDVVEYISDNTEKNGVDLTDADRETIAKEYANEIRNIENYKLDFREMNGFYIYDFVKYVDSFKTTDEIKVILLGDGTLYMLCYYTLGEFDELDKMYEVDEENNKKGPLVREEKVDEAVYKQVKKQFGDDTTYEEKEKSFVKKRNGEFAVLVVVDVFDSEGNTVAIKEKYYVTWDE